MQSTVLVSISKALLSLAALKAQPPAEIRAERLLIEALDKLFGEVQSGINPTGSAAATVADAVAEIAAIEGAVAETLTGATLDHADYGAGRVDQILQTGQITSLRQSSPLVVDFLTDSTFQASERTLSAVRGDITGVILQGYEDGVGVRVITERLDDVFSDLKFRQLQTVARTELHQGLNVGAITREKELGVTHHEWASAFDDRTRSSHVGMNGATVEVGELFFNGLEYPGDRRGPIGEWINCRCRLIPRADL